MARREERPAVRRNENVLSFERPPAKAVGADALDLVYQAAEIFNGIRAKCARNRSSRSRHVQERRGTSEAGGATNRIPPSIRCGKLSLTRIASLLTLPESSTEIELRITAAEDKAAAAEIRAHVAETEACEAKQSLALVEDAIRRRLLCCQPGSFSQIVRRSLTAPRLNCRQKSSLLFSRSMSDVSSEISGSPHFLWMTGADWACAMARFSAITST